MFTECELQHKGIIFSHGERQNADPCEGTRLCRFEERAFQSEKPFIFSDACPHNENGLGYKILEQTPSSVKGTEQRQAFNFPIMPNTNELTKPLPANCTTFTQQKH